MAKQFIFTITTGRSGTVYLTELLRKNLTNATIYHERTGYTSFGVHTPDASHFTNFNSVGNNVHVRNFWKQKFRRDAETATEYYVEVSHFLAKAGLLENLDILEEEADAIYIIVLTRDIFDTVWSYTNRFDFANTGFTWLFTLDHRYPNKIINPAPFLKYHMAGKALWYVHEMRVRGEYYKLILNNHPKIHFIDADLYKINTEAGATELLQELGTGFSAGEIEIPDKQNESKASFFGKEFKENLRKVTALFKVDHKALAKQFVDSGCRLVTPTKDKHKSL